MDSVGLNEFPGLNEAIRRARTKGGKMREGAWLSLPHDICGFRVRAMTLRDYIILERIESPFVHRLAPTMHDLALFLWMLSDGFQKHTGMAARIAGHFHGRRVRRAFGANPPDSSEHAVKVCFDYVDLMFADAPPSLASGTESPLCYLAAWFDALASEHGLTQEEVFASPLPQIFQRLSAIRARTREGEPTFDQSSDAIKAFIMNGLRRGDFTEEELKAGRVDFGGFN